MDLNLEATAKVGEQQTETYVEFRSAVPKPSHEDAHLRHILRFYIARSLLKRGEPEAFILPEVNVGGRVLRLDVAAGKPGKYSLAICEPGSITPGSEDLLEALRTVDGIDVLIVHSQYGKPGNVMEKFKPELDSGKFHLLAVVPPPFDDAYEYDIWMFETTFRNLMESS